MNRKRTSVAAVVAGIILFFPVGIYLLHKRLTEDKSEAIKSSRVVKGFGWFFIATGVICMIPTNDTTSDTAGMAANDILALAVIIGIGVFLLYRGRKMKKYGQRYILYNSMICNNRRNLDDIAASVNIPKVAVIKELQDLINEGYLQGGYIDKVKQEVLVPEFSNISPQNITIQLQPEPQSPRPQPQPTATNMQVKAPQRRVVICPNCGGNNECVEGTPIACEFCGSPISCE